MPLDDDDNIDSTLKKSHKKGNLNAKIKFVYKLKSNKKIITYSVVYQTSYYPVN